MAKVISWKAKDEEQKEWYLYLSGRTTGYGEMDTLIVEEEQDDEYVKNLAADWRTGTKSEYSSAFSALTVAAKEKHIALNGGYEKYFNVLSEKGVYMVTGKDGKNEVDSATPYYNIHLLNSNLAIGLGGDFTLDRAITASTRFYIERNNEIDNSKITSIQVFSGRTDDFEGVEVPSTTIIGNTYCTVSFGVPANTSFSNDTHSVDYIIKVACETMSYTGETVFTIAGVKDGKEGSLYNLVLRPGKIKKHANGALSSSIAKCAVVENGQDITNNLPDGFSLKYKCDSDEPSSALPYPSTGVSASTFENSVYFYLLNGSTVVDSDNCIIVEDGANAENRIIMDVSNEMDGITLGTDYILDTRLFLNTSFAIYSGMNTVLISKAEIVYTGDTDGISVATGETPLEDDYIAFPDNKTITFELPIDTRECKLHFRLSNGTNFENDEGHRKKFTIRGYAKDVSGALEGSYEILGVKGGKDGEVYKLVPSNTAIVYDPNTETYFPNSVTCSAILGTETITGAGISIFYQTTGDTPVEYSEAIQSRDIDENGITFYLRKDGIDLDIETVPLITNGIDSAGKIQFELENEMEPIGIGSDYVLDVPVDINIPFALKMSNETIAFDSLSLTANTTFEGMACDLAVDGEAEPIEGTFDEEGKLEFPIIESKNGKGTITIHLDSGITFDETRRVGVIVSIHTPSDDTTKSTVFSVMGVPSGFDGVVYRLDPSVDSILYNPNDDTFIPDSITCDANADGIPMEWWEEGDTCENDNFKIVYSLGTDSTYEDSRNLPKIGLDRDVWEVYDRIVFYLVYKDENIIIDREGMPVIKEGEKGEQGSKGAAVRGPIDWSSTKGSTRRFCNGKPGTGEEGKDDDKFIDVIKYQENENSDAKTYVCITSYTQKTTDTWETVSEHWSEPDESYDFIATNLLLAKNAKINFLSGTQILMQNNSDAVTAGISGVDGENGGYAFWAGAPSPATAPYKVAHDGSFSATTGYFKGSISAETGYFKGELKAATGSFSGAISAETGYFNGYVTSLMTEIIDLKHTEEQVPGKTGWYEGYTLKNQNGAYICKVLSLTGNESMSACRSPYATGATSGVTLFLPNDVPSGFELTIVVGNVDLTVQPIDNYRKIFVTSRGFIWNTTNIVTEKKHYDVIYLKGGVFSFIYAGGSYWYFTGNADNADFVHTSLS